MKSITFNPLPDDLDLLLDAFFAVEPDSTIQYASTGVELALGYTPEELIGKQLLDFVHPEDRHKTDGSVKRVMRTKAVMDFENRYIHKDGRIVHLLWSTSWSDKYQLRLGVARDITRIKQAEAMQKTLLAISETVHGDLTLKGIYPQLHQLLNTQISGLDICIALHRSHGLELLYKSDNDWQPSLVDLIPAQINTMTSEIAIDLQVKDKALGLIVFRLPAAMLNDNQQDLLQFTAAQITTALERQQMLERLQHMALYDPLTDLPNRQLFYDRLLQALARARREQHGLALLYLDLDKFKEVNDQLGHSAGDALLRDVAIRICTCVRDTDTVVRIGGDEFVVLLNGIESRLQAWSVAEKIRHILNQTFNWQNQSIEMSASIGVALFPEQGDNTEHLITAADNAMYRAKNSGKNCVR